MLISSDALVLEMVVLLTSGKPPTLWWAVSNVSICLLLLHDFEGQSSGSRDCADSLTLDSGRGTAEAQRFDTETLLA